MSEVTIVDNNIVRLTEEGEGIYPFSIIWNRDQSAHKELAMKDLYFIEFMCSPKRTNPFFGYTDPIIRRQKIIENIRKEIHNWEPDNLVEEGCAQWLEFWKNASPKMSYYLKALNAAKKLEDFFDVVDMNAELRSGAPKYKPKDITSALLDTKGVIANLASIEDEVNQDIFNLAKTKGSRITSVFEKAKASSS